MPVSDLWPPGSARCHFTIISLAVNRRVAGSGPMWGARTHPFRTGGPRVNSGPPLRFPRMSPSVRGLARLVGRARNGSREPHPPHPRLAPTRPISLTLRRARRERRPPPVNAGQWPRGDPGSPARAAAADALHPSGCLPCTGRLGRRIIGQLLFRGCQLRSEGASDDPEGGRVLQPYRNMIAGFAVYFA
jgi:hypothetical protein